MAPGIGIASVALLLAADPDPEPTRPAPIKVEFIAPAGCSSIDAFYAGLLSRTSRARRAKPGEETSRLIVQLTRVGGKVRGELRLLEVRNGSYTRTVLGEGCDEVADVLSLTAALAMEPPNARPPPVLATPVADAPPAPSPTISSANPTPTSPLPIIVEPADAMHDESRRFTIGLGVSTIGAQVIKPSIDFGSAISARLTRLRSGA